MSVLARTREILMTELEFYANNNISNAEKKERLPFTDRINKTASNVISIEALVKRNETIQLGTKEHQRLNDRFGTKSE